MKLPTTNTTHDHVRPAENTQTMPLETPILRRLFIVYTTLCDTLKARGYTLPSLPNTLDEFQSVFGNKTFFCRESLTFFATKANSDRVAVMFISSPENKAISIQQIRNTLAKLRNQHVAHGVIVHEQALSPGAKKLLIEYTCQSNCMTVESFEEHQLLFNVLDHELVPKVRCLSKEEKQNVLSKYRIVSSQLPHMLRSDPMARYIGCDKGDVIEITRPSETAGEYVFYRLCI